MPWWGWLVVGTALLGAEVAIQTEFWLAVLGAAAVAVSLALLAGLSLPVWGQWLGFAGLSVLLAVTVRRQVRDKLASRTPGLKPELLGEHGTSRGEIAPGSIGSVEVRGSTWRARNVGDTALREGDAIRVEAVEGLTLDVRS
jgi:membrane protein implicated in regulation of membrane protease activity